MKTKHFLSLPLKAMLCILLGFMGYSCNKTTESIGNGLLPEGDLIGVYFTDTVAIECHSTLVDSIITKGMTSILLGSMVDPIMGRTDASIFTQLHISSTNQQFGDQPIIDSVVLQLAYSDYFGDTNTLQTVHVYELADSLVGSQYYYQFDDVAIQPEDLAQGFQFYPRPKTTGMVIGTDTLTQAVLRIPLSNSFGERLVQADTSVYSAPEYFKEYIYGLKICCESVSQDGAICSFYPTSNTITVLQLYYHENPEAESRMRYNYYITSDDVYFNQYLHDYSMGSPEFVSQVVDGNTALGQQQLYLQSMGGVHAIVRFPHLTEWTKPTEHSHILINEAKLILPTSTLIADSSQYATISTLALLNIKENGTSLLPDYLEGTNYYGGSYNTTTRQVVFRISEYLQQLLNGRLYSDGIYLSITGASYNPLRWILAGPTPDEGEALRCEIKYSIVEE
ncbi:MAG: DUF4270 family protein [Bacteroidales bacterium]|nr:DUF4270 family protein [Bacteroidales bacterium]